VLQAEGIKVGAEALRRARPRTMGSLYWQLDDCWPVASWSSIDYFGRWKALHYYARRFYAELLASTSEQDGQIVVSLVSDRTAALRGELALRLRDFSGAVLWEEKKAVEVAPLASQQATSIERERLLAGRDPQAVFLQVELLVDGKPVATNLRFFVPPKQLSLRKPRITSEVTQADGLVRVRLSSDTLARHVRLSYDDADADGFFGDNYFDLLPGSPVEVVYTPKGAVSLEAFKKDLSVVSLIDAF
jgi:beta-mannosidase